MSIFRNPVARREWVWVRRHWPVSVAFVLTAVAASLAMPLVVLPRAYQQLPMMSWGLGQLVGGVLSVPLLAVVYLTLHAIERERRSNGWEELASTRLGVSEVLWGKMAIPIAAGWLIGVVMQTVSLVSLMHWVSSSAQPSSWSMAIVYSAIWPLGIVRDLTYAVMASLLAFRFGWRRSFGHAFLVTYGVLAAIGIGMSLLGNVAFRLATLVLSAAGSWGNTGWDVAAQYGTSHGAAVVVEVWIAVRVFRAIERQMRSDLAGELGSRLG